MNSQVKYNGLCVNFASTPEQGAPFRGSPRCHYSYDFEDDDNDSTKKRQIPYFDWSEARVEPRKHAFFEE